MPRTRDAAATRLGRRKAALKKKAQELVTRCNVEVAVLCAYPGDDPLMWPSNQEVLATARRYNALPPEDRERNTEDSADQAARRLDEELDKLVRAQEGGVAGALGSWDGSLEGMSVEELRELLESIDGSLAAARSSGGPEQLPQNGGVLDHDSIMPADEATEETSLSLTATSASNGERPQQGEADKEGDESALPEEENPTKSPNAAPLVANQVTAENSVPATAEGAGNGVRLREADAGGDNLELPPKESPGATNAAPSDADDAAAGQDEGDDVQMLQPRGDADADADEAEFMRSLLDALKEIPPPPNAAPYWSEMEYLYMGRGFAMECDAYDFICFDLGMPPPYIGPDLLDSDDDDPIQLWSWE